MLQDVMNTAPRMTHLKNLDALRFWAAFFVILSHLVGYLQFPYGLGSFIIKKIISLNRNGGLAGVSFFFVLSGFLITYLMFLEIEKTGTFRVLFFYARRFLRIWPLYFLVLFIGFFAYPFVIFHLENRVFEEHARFLFYATFLANFDNIYWGFPSTGILGVQWSVAIEEQFYLFWPLLFIFLKKRQFFPWIAAGLIALSNLAYALNFNSQGFRQFHTICALNDLAVGALMAYFFLYKPDQVSHFFAKVSRGKTLLIYMGGFLMIYFMKDLIAVSILGYFTRLLPACFFAFVILEQILSPHSLFKVGAKPFFTWLGQLSYGLYLFHMVAISIVVLIIERHPLNIFLQIFLALGLTVLLSFLSFRFIERPFLNLKKRFTPLAK